MAYVVFYGSKPSELYVGLSVRPKGAEPGCYPMARALADTGATDSCIDTEFAVRELKISPAGFVEICLPSTTGALVAKAVPAFDVTVSVPERTREGFVLPDGCSGGEIERTLRAVGLDSIPGSDGSNVSTLLFMIGMDLLSSVCFGYGKAVRSAVFWLANPAHSEDACLITGRVE